MDKDVADKIREIIRIFEDNTMGQAATDIVTYMVRENSAILTVKAFVYIVDAMARTQSQILSGNTPGKVTPTEVYAAMYSAAGLYSTEENN